MARSKNSGIPLCPCLNGCVHFTADYFVAAAGDNVSYASVLALDLRADVFREMMPKDMIRLELRIDEIDTRIYRGSLALLHYNTNRNQTQERYCFIWVMKEYGVVDSWVKQFTIDLNVHWNVLGFTKNCQPILTIGGQSWECELSSLDSKSQQVTKLGMHGDGEDRTICVDTYRENLVLLKTESCLTQNKRCRSQMESGQEDEEDHKEQKK
ncbi:uncharacterized protein LOC132182203 [Corylus avellana]|uniref:uncharacterized protein LOC132182203 n=1 Tax=Corylus avellana TaxID=13451 RepID=UPI00286A624B|nr:uncharacterized protein LOC132182203 [Corylus avellana]